MSTTDGAVSMAFKEMKNADSDSHVTQSSIFGSSNLLVPEHGNLLPAARLLSDLGGRF